MPSAQTTARLAAILLAVGSAWVLTGLATDPVGEGTRPFLPTFFKGLGVTAVFQVGLFWAPTARGWWRLLAAGLMVPAALIFAGMTGEVLQKILRGFPLHPLLTIVAVTGVAAYGWQFWSLAQRSIQRRP